MHLSSLDNMKKFREHYLAGMENTELEIFDLGSMAIGGCYRSIFDAEKWTYTGVDLAEGENVDLVLSDPYSWSEIRTESVDVFVSGQAFEHIEFFWQTMLEIARALKPGGLCCIIAPSGGPEHKYPVDCWRFYPDGFRALARYAGLDALEIHTDWEPDYTDGSEMWADTVLVARKPEHIQKTPDTHHIYNREIDPANTGDSLSRVIRYIQPGTRVLELGPATGYLTRYMTEKLGCTVDCIELSPEMAEESKHWCNRMVVANLDTVRLEDYFNEGVYDFIIIADVLEHLRSCEQTVASCRRLLKPSGRCILSVPNIAHASVIGQLLRGDFNYTDEGLLDRTHVHFFTRKSLIRLLESGGLAVEMLELLQKLPEDTESGDSLTALPVEVQKRIFDTPDALTYQFIMVCGPAENTVSCEEPESVSAPDLRKLFIKSLTDRIGEMGDALAEAENLAHSRLAETGNLRENIRQLDKALADAEKLAGSCMEEVRERDVALARAEEITVGYLHENRNLDNELAIARKLAYERLDKISELDNALAHAQKIAYEKIAEIEACHAQLEACRAAENGYQQEIESLRQTLKTCEENIGYKAYEKMKSMMKIR